MEPGPFILLLAAVVTASLVVALFAQALLWRYWSLPQVSSRVRSALRQWARARVVAVVVFLVSSAGLLLSVADGYWSLAWLVPLGVLVYALRDLITDSATGILLMARLPFGEGDLVETGGRRGVVVRAGLTSLRIRGFDHIEHDLPWTALVRQGVSRMSLRHAEVPVEVDLPWRTNIAPGDARSIAAVCAATSPFASLHSRPETFLVADGSRQDDVRVRVRGYVFDAAYAEAFQSHVLEAWLERTASRAAQN